VQVELARRRRDESERAAAVLFANTAFHHMQTNVRIAPVLWQYQSDTAMGVFWLDVLTGGGGGYQWAVWEVSKPVESVTSGGA
jgi:hypothetical protein